MWFANTRLVINERVVSEGVISAFHFSETRVFDLFSLLVNILLIYYTYIINRQKYHIVETLV